MTNKRNRYYHGKMLRTEDFVCEQQYLLHQIQKRTVLLSGIGILQGLHVKKSGNEQIMISAGSALDEDGHIIELRHDYDIAIRELVGFSHLHTYAGWLYLQYEQLAVDKEFCEFPYEAQHEEYGKWQDGWKLHIQAERDKDIVECLFFQEEVIYTNDDIKFTLLMPCILPEAGNVKLMLKVVKQQVSSYIGTLYVRSSHYDIEPFTVQMEKDVYSQEYMLSMTRNPYKKGCHVEVVIERLKQNEQYERIDKYFYTEMQRDVKIALASKSTSMSTFNVQKIILGHIDFLYQEDQLVITRVEECGRNELISSQMAMMFDQYVQRLHVDHSPISYVQTNEKEQQTSCGLVTMLCDQKQSIYYSEEILHGLGPVEAMIQVAFEHKEAKQPMEYQDVICSGEPFLCQGIQYGIRMYPLKGSFQIVLQVPKKHDATVLRLHWYAIRAQMPQEEKHIRLLRLEPSAITMKPKERSHFTAVFDGMEDVCNVRYVLEDDQAGELKDDGTFIAKDIPGMYQVKAYYHEQQVNAYVKVVLKHE